MYSKACAYLVDLAVGASARAAPSPDAGGVGLKVVVRGVMMLHFEAVPATSAHATSAHATSANATSANATSAQAFAIVGRAKRDVESTEAGGRR